MSDGMQRLPCGTDDWLYSSIFWNSHSSVDFHPIPYLEYKMEQERTSSDVSASHNGQDYFYRPLTAFDEIGYPKQFADCAHVLS